MDVGTPRVTSHLKQETYSRERRRHSDPLRLQSLGQRTPVRRAGKNQRTPIYGAGSKQFPVDPRNRTPHPVCGMALAETMAGQLAAIDPGQPRCLARNMGYVVARRKANR